MLDRALGLEPHYWKSERMRELALELATELPFKRAAKLLAYLTPSVSPMGICNTVKTAGEEAFAAAARYLEGKKPFTNSLPKAIKSESGVRWPHKMVWPGCTGLQFNKHWSKGRAPFAEAARRK